jgi:hypothetical protein
MDIASIVLSRRALAQIIFSVMVITGLPTPNFEIEAEVLPHNLKFYRRSYITLMWQLGTVTQVSLVSPAQDGAEEIANPFVASEE